MRWYVTVSMLEHDGVNLDEFEVPFYMFSDVFHAMVERAVVNV